MRVPPLLRMTKTEAQECYPGSGDAARSLGLAVIYYVPGGGWSRPHLVAQTRDGRTLTWVDGKVDGVRMWCSMWNVVPWGAVQYSSPEWLRERLERTP